MLCFLVTSILRFAFLPYYLNVKVKYSVYMDIKEIMPYTNSLTLFVISYAIFLNLILSLFVNASFHSKLVNRMDTSYKVPDFSEVSWRVMQISGLF